MAEDNKEKEILENEKENNTNNEELNKIENSEKTENKETEKEKTESKEEPKTEEVEDIKEESNNEPEKEENKEEIPTEASAEADRKAEKEENKEAETEKKENNKEEQNKKELKETEKKENVKKFEPIKKEINTNNKQKSKNTKSKKEKKPKEKKSGKGNFTRVVAIVVILLAIIGLIYLAIPTPEKTVNNMFESLKKGDFEQTSQYINYNEVSLINQLEEEENTEINADEKILFESLEWNIKSINEQGETASIEVEVTNKDYEVAFKNYIQEMFKKFLNNEDISEQEQFDLLLNEIKKEETGTKTTTQTITAVKENGKWRITADDNLTKALYPGLEEGINSISNILIN